ncbi:MAG TPA: 50S ribosomal protein L18 [Candidatus Aenigmarchaeota archaeon]|nr:50S ribosomal protein L18 [Candidatus Aenigmarchaeota archaeon]
MHSTYKLPHRRRREKKTDYRLRLALLKSGKHRLVVRKSNKYVLGQIIKYEKEGDRTLVSVNSRSLKKLGWKHGCGNLPAAYLTGLILGKKAREMGIEEAVLDIGLHTSTKGNKLYALMKGVVDAGVKVNHSEEILPSEERIRGEHISEEVVKDFETFKKKIME